MDGSGSLSVGKNCEKSVKKTKICALLHIKAVQWDHSVFQADSGPRALCLTLVYKMLGLILR